MIIEFVPKLFMRSPLIACFAISACLPLLTSCSGTNTATVAVQPAANIWVVAWGASPENAQASTANPGGAEQTFRSFFYPTVSGTKERVRFSNYFGSEPVTVGAARLAVAATPPAVDSAHDVALSFNGNAFVTIAPGMEVTSDPVSLAYSFGQKMAVTAYMQGTFAPLSQHFSDSLTNYNSAANAGNTTTDSAGSTFGQANQEWFLLSGMDVYGQYQGTIAIFGSSTIDGHASNYSDTNSYPVANVPVPGQDNDRISDALARTLNSAGYHLGVLNAGVLGESAGPTTVSVAAQPGIDRIDRDVLHQPGIKTVVIDLGQVDLRANACGQATDVEAALQNMVAQANTAGVRVILGTIAPATYCTNPTSPNYGPNPVNDGGPFAGDINPGPRNPENVQRQLVNTWIKTTGVTLPGVVGVADFETALAGTEHPDFLTPNLNSGDNFHPDGAGYQVKSSAIPINSILESTVQ